MLALVLTIVATIAAVAAAAYARRALYPLAIEKSQRKFVDARRAANANRTRLSYCASMLLSSGIRLPNTSLRTFPEWMFSSPVHISSIRLTLNTALPTLLEPHVAKLGDRYLPLNPSGRFNSYSDALGALDRPRLYSNRLSYRLLSFQAESSSGTRSEMIFGLCRYFEMLDVGEVLTMEFAMSREGKEALKSVSSRSLRREIGRGHRFRRAIGGPAELWRRPVSPSINTLTLRVTPNGAATYFLHLRDAHDVALASGQTHVIPCGGFQPSSASRLGIEQDFDLWRNVSREYAEEFLGLAEATSDVSDAIDFEAVEPYASLTAGSRSGTIRPWIFGIAFDPLSYYIEVLTAVTFHSHVFDRIFPNVVAKNDEGMVVRGDNPRRGIPFTQENVARTLADQRLAPAGAACLTLAWQHRAKLMQ